MITKQAYKTMTTTKQAKQTRGLKWKIGAGAFALLTAVQFGLLYKIDSFLQPPSLPTVSTAVQGSTQPIDFTVPPDAVKYEISSDRLHLAYITEDNRLVLMAKDGSQTIDTAGSVPYFKWLGNSNTLLYFVQGTYLDAYLLQSNQSKPVLIHEWYGKQREVANTFFSPYMEYLYIELRNGLHSEVYKYDAVSGIRQLPLGTIQIENIQYDDMSDDLNITASTGLVWRYSGNTLYRPDGTKVVQSVTPHPEHPSSSSPATNKAGSAMGGAGKETSGIQPASGASTNSTSSNSDVGGTGHGTTGTESTKAPSGSHGLTTNTPAVSQNGVSTGSNTTGTGSAKTAR